MNKWMAQAHCRVGHRTVGLEYDYSAFQTKSYQLAGTAPGVYTFDAKPRDVQSAVVRLNYRFGAPLVARY